MSAMFTRASSQYLLNSSPPVTAYPITVGMWVNMLSVSAVLNTLVSFVDTGSTTNFFRLDISSTEVPQIGYSDTASGFSAANGSAMTAGTWHFLLGRFISTSTARLSQLTPAGNIVNAATSATRTPAGIDSISIGRNQTSSPDTPCDALIAEFWYTNIDVQPDGGVSNGDLVRQLAYGGPFSMPHVAASLIEYRSFRKSLASDSDESAECYQGSATGQQIWTNNNGATVGPHPPLPYWYQSPQDFIRNVMV